MVINLRVVKLENAIPSSNSKRDPISFSLRPKPDDAKRFQTSLMARSLSCVESWHWVLLQL